MAAAHKFDPNFTKAVIDSFGPKTTPRLRELLGSLITHIHDFARETELTTEEWMIGVNFINTIGQGSTPIRNEGHRICDVIGLESLVDEIAHKHISETGDFPTSSTILGPFWSPRAPFRELGGDICQDPTPGCQHCLMSGKIIDVDTKKGIPGAVIDIWEASANGKYDFQDPENQSDNNLRGKFRTDENGDYHFYMLKPTAYTLPTDGAAGVLLNAIDRHAWRPAHIHLMMSHPDYKTVTTQIYPRDDPHVTNDTVFAVKDDLLIDFTPRENDPKAKLNLLYNVRLAAKKNKTPGDAPGDASNTVGLDAK